MIPEFNSQEIYELMNTTNIDWKIINKTVYGSDIDSITYELVITPTMNLAKEYVDGVQQLIDESLIFIGNIKEYYYYFSKYDKYKLEKSFQNCKKEIVTIIKYTIIEE